VPAPDQFDRESSGDAGASSEARMAHDALRFRMILPVRQELDHRDSHIRMLPQEDLELTIFDHK
jgi:hypothetical protein